jgi:hypothetical protein
MAEITGIQVGSYLNKVKIMRLSFSPILLYRQPSPLAQREIGPSVFQNRENQTKTAAHNLQRLDN